MPGEGEGARAGVVAGAGAVADEVDGRVLAGGEVGPAGAVERVAVQVLARWLVRWGGRGGGARGRGGRTRVQGWMVRGGPAAGSWMGVQRSWGVGSLGGVGAVWRSVVGRWGTVAVAEGVVGGVGSGWGVR